MDTKTITKPKLTMEAYMELSKKWAVFLLKDMFLGAKRFNDFLEVHPEISNRVLSDQLKGLEKYGYIKKIIVSTTPLKAEYELDELGLSLNKMLYEKAMWAIKHGLGSRNDNYFKGKDIEKAFGIKK
ncbi:transcriptional regulator [Candidatus Woesearchaeota archaeon]|nr:MAG: transcriptional regulator [Candidatus Woesearchaeota archaeon]